MRVFYGILFIFLMFFPVFNTSAQTELDERAIVNFKKGLGFYSADSTIAINLKFRMQNIVGITTISGEDLGISDIEARVKRLRLRFDGFIKNRDITYYMQFGFTQYDQDWDNSASPNLVRDAMIYYHFNEKLYIGFGQSKLPGNRQRVISSGAQQFIERSVVNSNFTLDRDFGVFTYYSTSAGPVALNFKGAVSEGEGRVTMNTDAGLCYTGRIEVLPLGQFSSSGDFFEGDLQREPKPRLSLGGGYSFNDNARKTNGQRGSALFQQRDMSNVFADMVFKYNGIALSSEYISRSTDNAITIGSESDTVAVFTGYGLNTQLSYLFPCNVELAMRYAFVKPFADTKYINPQDTYYTFGVSKYVKKHLLKIQTNLSYNQKTYLQPNSPVKALKDRWLLQFQVELGI